MGAYDLGRRWRLGARFVFYTGSPYSDSYPPGQGSPLPPLNDQRYPPFYRVDVRLEKRWSLGKERSIAFVAEVLNATLSKEARAYDCSGIADRLDQLDARARFTTSAPSPCRASGWRRFSSPPDEGIGLPARSRMRPSTMWRYASSCVLSGALAAFGASRAFAADPPCSPIAVAVDAGVRRTLARAPWAGAPGLRDTHRHRCLRARRAHVERGLDRHCRDPAGRPLRLATGVATGGRPAHARSAAPRASTCARSVGGSA